MKSYLSKLGVLLFGAMFAVAACQDYDEDIRKVNDELNTELTDLTSKLDAAIADLEGKHNADIEALQSDLEALEGKIEDAKTALTAAYTAADAALKGELEGELQEQINAAVAQVEEVIAGIDAAYKAADAEVLADAKAYVDGKVDALNKTIEELKAADKTNADAIAKVAADLAKAQTDLAAADAALQAQITALAADVEANEAAIAQLQKDLKEAKAAIEANKEDINANALAIEALTDAHAKDIADVKALINANTKAIEAEAAARAAADKELEAAYKAADDALKAELKKRIDANASAIATLQETAADLQDQITKLDAAYKAADAALAAEIEAAIAKAESDLAAAKAELEAAYKAADADLKAAYEAADAALAAEIETLNTKLNGLRVDVDTLIARVQSLVYVPDYDDAKATLRFAVIESDTETVYVPGKSTLRYKVNSTNENIVEEIVAAYAANNSILSFDLEGVKVRANEGDAKIEIVGVDSDEDGYLVVEVLAQNFLPDFYSFKNRQVSYSAALVLAQEDKMNDVASEFTNFVPTTEFDFINLAVKFTKGDSEVVYTDGKVDLKGKTPFVNESLIPSADTEKVVETTASKAYVLVEGDQTYYTTEELYKEYGYQVEIKSHAHVASYLKNGKLDLPTTVAHLCWEESHSMWNNTKFNIDNPTAVGTSRKVSLTSYEEADKAKYDERVYSYVEVVDAYFLGGQQVAVADKVEISKNLVYVNFDAVTYDWTLQRALDLRGEDGTPYANDVVIENVKYDNIYDLNPIFNPGNIVKTTPSLNGEYTTAALFLSDITAPKAGQAGTAVVTVKGYEFAAADAEKPNTYNVVWQVVLSETTDAIITLNVTFGKYPETVVVNSEVDLELVTEGNLVNNFKGADALIADAYAALGAEKSGFAENAKVNDILFTALTDKANVTENDPNSAYNLNFAVKENVDESFVILYHSQIEDVANVKEAYNFSRNIKTWFGVPFKFNVTGKPQLPEVELVRSTEYAYEGSNDKEFLVNLKAGLDKKLYTVTSSDLAFYLNTIGEANATQKVSFAVLDGAKSTIANNVTSVVPVDEPINNPEVGLVTAYLAKKNSILTWMDAGTQIKVKATLWAGAYPIDYATLILNVDDPLTFTAGNVEAKREVKKDTDVKVFKNFKLTSTVEEHKGIENLLNVEAESLKDILATEYLTAYNANVTVKKLTVYEKVGDAKVIYDDTKYALNEETGIFTLRQDDAAVLINPIVAEIVVTFTHDVDDAMRMYDEVGEKIDPTKLAPQTATITVTITQ